MKWGAVRLRAATPFVYFLVTRDLEQFIHAMPLTLAGATHARLYVLLSHQGLRNILPSNALTVAPALAGCYVFLSLQGLRIIHPCHAPAATTHAVCYVLPRL